MRNFLACKFDLNHSERKSTQVHCARPGKTESQVDPSFQLASTYESFGQGFKMFLFLRLECACEGTFGHPTEVTTHVQLASTCDYCLSVWPGLRATRKLLHN